ncbi:hypothetical protein [Treponema sp. UBA3813]|uniref:hypothetical protein n=1 Tax=Treponema sp. UBA3813 TaxID=1947715 RepID=UPI0025CC8422|nr:hypothetical protein [Treponema sp. UBA3813]
MKISKITTFAFCATACFVSGVFFVSCGSSAVATTPVVEAEKTLVDEPVVEQPEGVVAEPTVQAEDDEYSRSVGGISVSRDTFAEDKETILRIISELDVIMKDPGSTKSYNAWVGYVDQESVDYWKLRKNLQKAEKRLPVKGIKLSSLQDYFKNVFVPARRGREVSEIRYISDTYIKAIQVQGEQDIVYYYFNKINGRWMVHLPPIDD